MMILEIEDGEEVIPHLHKEIQSFSPVESVVDSGLESSHDDDDNFPAHVLASKLCQNLCPVVRLEKLSKQQIYLLTKHKDRAKTLKDFIFNIRSKKRDIVRKDQISRKSVSDIEDLKNKQEAIKTFLDFYLCGDNLYTLSASLEKFNRTLGVDIDRYSDTLSIAGSERSYKRSSRKRIAPPKFNIDYELKPKRVKIEKPKPDPEIEYQVEEIFNMNLVKGKLSFLIKWENYPPSANTWEPLDNIRDCKALDVYLDYELKGEEETIQKMIDEIITEEKPLIEKRKKSWILEEIRKLDLVEFECNKIVYKAIYSNEVDYNAFKRKFRHQVIINHFRELQISQEKEHEIIRQEFMEKELNMFEISIENNVDFDVLNKFTYIRETLIPPELKIKTNTIGCKCTQCSVDSSLCCSTLGNQKNNFGYKEVGNNKVLRLRTRQMIYECNENCACKENCINRVTQQPRTYPMTIFKTNDGRGWGVKATTSIPRGTFLMEYTGEVIDQEESCRRGMKQDEKGLRYMFDLDFNENNEAVYTVDADYCGNLSRLINHNCHPNCSIWPVTTCNQDSMIYKLCYFTQRKIRAGEELSIDYTGGGDILSDDEEDDDQIEGKNEQETDNNTNETINKISSISNNRTQHKAIQCKCKSANCRGKMFL